MEHERNVEEVPSPNDPIFPDESIETEKPLILEEPEKLPPVDQQDIPLKIPKSLPTKLKPKTTKRKKKDSCVKEKHNKKFTPEEDEKLKTLVETYGEGTWSFIAKKMNDRNRKQVRERYINFLSTERVETKFTQEEDDTILQYVQEKGRKWSALAELLPGRTPIMIKNRYYSKLQKTLKESEQGKVTNNSIQSSLPSPGGSIMVDATGSKLIDRKKYNLRTDNESKDNMREILLDTKKKIKELKTSKANSSFSN